MGSASTDDDLAAVGSSNNSTTSLPKEQVKLSAVEQIVIPMTWWRSLDMQTPNPILGDPYAAGILDRCEVDMNKAYFKHDHRWIAYSCNRSRTLDKWCQQFIDTYADTEPVQIVHLGCGLDTRNLRVQWADRGPDKVRWFDVDLPMVADLRERVVPPHPSTSGPDTGYNLRRLSVTEEGWYRDIPADRRTMVVSEVMVYHCRPEKVRKLFHDIVEYFDLGGQIAIDIIGSVLVKHKPMMIKNHDELQPAWGIDEARDIEKFHPGLKMTGRIRWEDYLGEGSLGQNAPPMFGPWMSALLSVRQKSAFRNALQVVKFDFGLNVKSVESSDLS